MNNGSHHVTSCYDTIFTKFEYIFEPALIQEICEVSTLKTFKENQYIIEIGQIMTHIPLVLSGSIKIMTENKDGEELLLYYMETGDTCSITIGCCTKPTKSTINAVAESETTLVMIPMKKMDEWMVKYSTWRNFILESYNGRMKEMLAAIDNLAFNNMEERIQKYLKDRVLVSKETKIHITHQQIATDLHSSRVVVSRIMKKLEQENKITQHRNFVSVH